VNHNDPETIAVRQTVTDIAGRASQPTPEAVARTWARIDGGRPHIRPARPWLAWSAAAAAVVAISLAATALLHPVRGRTALVGTPATPTRTMSPADTSQPPTTTSPTPAPQADLGRIVRSVPLAQAVNAMVHPSAPQPPLAPGPGELIYTRIDTAEPAPGGRLDTHVHEIWTDPDGMVVRRILIDGADIDVGSPGPPGPVNLQHPTRAYLAGLTTNPTTLYHMFAALNAGTKLGGVHYVTKELSEAFQTYGAILPTAQRAAFFQVYLRVPGETARQISIGGHLYYGFRDLAVPDRYAFDLLADPVSGQVVGERYGSTLVELWHCAVVNSVNEIG
jgi:hypothetical protein